MRRVSTLRALLLCLAFAVQHPASSAVPGIPGVTSVALGDEPVAETSAPLAGAPDEKTIQTRLAAAEAELERISSAEGERDGVPAGTPNDEIFGRTFMMQALVSGYQAQLDAQQRLALLRGQQSDGVRDGELQADEQLDGKPPYPVPVVDELRQRLQAASQHLDLIEIQQKLADKEIDAVRAAHQAAERKQRESVEALERNRDAGRTARLNWLYQLAQLDLKTYGVIVQARELSRQVLEMERTLASARFRALQQVLAQADGQIRFSREDLDALTLRGEGRTRQLDAEISAARAQVKVSGSQLEKREADLAQQQAALKRAVDELDTARLAPLDPKQSPQTRQSHLDSLEVAVAKARARVEDARGGLELARFRTETALLRVESLSRLEMSIKLQRTFWELRFAAAQPDASAESSKRLHEGVSTLLERLREPEGVAREALKQTMNQAMVVQARLYDVAAGNAANDRELLASMRERIDMYVRALAEMGQLRQLVERWVEEFDRNAADRSARDKWLAVRNETTSRALAMWQYELTAVDDSLVVDGQIVPIKRGITVGKVAIALLTLVLGFWLARRAAVLVIHNVHRRLGTPLPTLQTASNWILSLVFVVLVVISLAMVRIPLTVFAFLGGAIAIGLGFGMQTLLKNLMSGLMLLAERPFKLGDFVEVGGMRGTVTDIGVRASTIRNADGIETLVPNASFVEQNVTNWTYSSSKVRFSVLVGVAYGSPTRAVADSLLEIAGRHGKILKDPAPEVLFEDFAADALNFGLYFWLDLDSGATGRGVCSDIRFMIDKAFAEAGIEIAFPQRDVHLDSAKPLEVRVVGASPTLPA
jgi:potassium-dependent mechanosensitive channel